MSRYASRKFLLSLLVLASATGLVLGGHIADGVYSAVVIADLTAYLASNVTQSMGYRSASPDIKAVAK
jgi:hypothetical protein